MKDLIIEHIERRARLDHGGDFSKAATDYFRDYPEDLRRYREEATGVNKRAGEDREKVNAEVHYRIEMVANWISTSQPIGWRHRRKFSPRIPICISATQPRTPCVLARSR